MKTMLALALAFSLQPLTLLAQGSLTPPGPPGQTMKSLDQIEPRTLLSVSNTPGNTTNVFIITQPGSYYLAGNVSISAGNAITIATNGVTLDLMGFNLSSSANPPAGTGIFINGSDVTVLNGHIKGTGTLSSGPGFLNGISSSASPNNVRVSGVSVSICNQKGIDVLGIVGQSSTVEHCNVYLVGGDGIRAWVVAHSIARNCGGYGIFGQSVDNCYGHSSGSQAGVYANTAVNCSGLSGSGNGIDAVSATACYGQSIGLGSGGYGVNASAASGCYGYNTSGSTSGYGLNANTAVGCYGFSANANGINVSTASSCWGQGGSGDGVYAFVASGCYGQSGGLTGIAATVAHNCYGHSDSGDGVYATIAANCYGDTGTGNGLIAFNAGVMCCGHRTSPSGYNCVIGETGGTINLP